MAGLLSSIEVTSSLAMRALRPKLDEYRSSIASFAALNGIALIFLWISRGTELHQLAIGIVMSLITLTIAMALFELCWCVGLRVAARRGSEKDKNDN